MMKVRQASRSARPSSWTCLCLSTLPLLFTALIGCCSHEWRGSQNFPDPIIATRHNVSFWPHRGPDSQPPPDRSDRLASARWHLAEARDLERRELDGCLEHYYLAAVLSWRQLDEDPDLSIPAPQTVAAWKIYHESLACLLAAAHRHGRLDAREKLVIGTGAKQRVIRIVYRGFSYEPGDFTRLYPAEEYQRHDIARHYETRGLGTSLVAVRSSPGEEPFRSPRQYFPVTAVLRPRNSQFREVTQVRFDPSLDPGADLEFYNPLLIDSSPLGSHVVGLSRDLTAPLARLLQSTPRRFTEGLLDPDDAEVQARLFMHEPYQPGKIPVVFIHGLWSDPVTWIDMVNDLRAEGDLYQKYQFWFFRYPTGRGLLESSAELRESLLVARDFLDPRHEDQALERIVLVGHSMGGIVAKLQIADSREIMWRHAASRELDAVRTTPNMRERLRRMFFFEASPLVRCTVSIGTPHRGSEATRRGIARVASRLVRISPDEEARYRELMDNNRDIFAEYLWDSWPTSIDLLEPDNPLLQAISKLPLNPRVERHTIIGNATINIRGEPTDDVVSVTSARQFGVASELTIPVRHKDLHHDLAASRHVARILRIHARQWDAGKDMLGGMEVESYAEPTSTPSEFPPSPFTTRLTPRGIPELSLGAPPETAPSLGPTSSWGSDEWVGHLVGPDSE